MFVIPTHLSHSFFPVYRQIASSDGFGSAKSISLPSVGSTYNYIHRTIGSLKLIDQRSLCFALRLAIMFVL